MSTHERQGVVSTVSRISVHPYSYEEGSIAGRPGGAPTIAYQLSLPEGARAAVLLLHGYGEHGGRYRRVIERWAKKKLATAVPDLRGHGWSAGARGYCDRFSDYHEDVDDMLSVLRQRAPGVPVFGFGHSFGGLITATYALGHPGAFQGIVLSSPYFGLALQVPGAKKLAGQLASHLMPKLALPSGLKGSDLTHDETIARLYDTDPLVNKGATARWFTESSGAQRYLLARAAQIRSPIVVFQGGADRVASPAAARAVFDRLGSADKKFDERNGLFHEILNEPDVGLEIADEMADWILAHV
jgi:alpha-beta hydrolase superfamily lysophospholipase